jgi:senataxin
LLPLRVETLHQSFELLKLLLTCCIRSRPNYDSTESFKRSCFTIENFCRRVKRHKTLLDEGQLSELFDLINPFVEREHVLSDSDSHEPTRDAVRSKKPATATDTTTKAVASGKNAFSAMMQKAGHMPSTSRVEGIKKDLAAKPSKYSSASERSSPAPASYDSDDEFPEFMLDDSSVKQLARAEREAASKSMQRNLDRMQARPTAKAGTVPTKSSYKSTVPSRVGGSTSVLGRLRQEAAIERKNKDAAAPRVSMSHISRDRQEKRPIYNAAANIRARAPSESSNTTDSEDDGGLGALQKLQKEAVKAVNRPKIQILRTTRVAPRMTDAERQRLAAFRTKMRLKPDIGELFRTIMLWDPSDRGPIKNYNLNKIPSKFRTPEDYQKAFTALFFQELRDQSRSELDDESNNKNAVPISVEIINKQHSDDYLDLELNPVGVNMLDGWYVNDSDLCIIRRGDLQVFAIVRGFKRGKNITINVRVHNSREKYGMDVKDRWFVVKHMKYVHGLPR